VQSIRHFVCHSVSSVFASTVLAGIAFLFSTVLAAQNPNLIPNPGFEQYRQLPDGSNTGKQCLQDWTVPLDAGNGDYYNEAGARGFRPSQNKYGRQAPFEGQAMTAICNYNGFREFLQVQLLAPLQKDSLYVFSVRISCADLMDSNDVLHSLSALFLDKPVKEFNGDSLLTQPPPLRWGNDRGFNDRRNWITLTQEYKANGTERVLLFGAFHWIGPKTGKEFGNLDGIAYTHYYVDGFELRLRERPLNGAADVEQIFAQGDVLVLRNLLFATGSAKLNTRSAVDLDELALYLHKHPTAEILITGHTDSEGDSVQNQMLSAARAESVKNYLHKKGIAKNRMSTQGKGESQPVMPNSTEGGKLLNRRVEIRLLKD
jgi:outer membrane protein OmpA-like peptidoglycan-associated protein